MVVSVALVCLAFALKALLLLLMPSDELYSVSKSFQPDFGALLATKPLPLRMLYFGRGGGLRLFLQPFSNCRRLRLRRLAPSLGVDGDSRPRPAASPRLDR